MITKFLSLLQKANRYLKKAGDIHLLQSSDLFDKDWYLTNNLDVANTKVNPVCHYLQHGGFEGRDPSPNFCSSWYMYTYEDVRKTGLNPLVHYLKYGFADGRQACPKKTGNLHSPTISRYSVQPEVIGARKVGATSLYSQLSNQQGIVAMIEKETPAPFIVGMSRSGTTLLRMMLDANPELAIPPETHFIPAAVQACKESSNPQQAFFKALTSHPRWNDQHINIELLQQRITAIEPFNVSDALRVFYRLYAEKFNKPRWGDKSPSYRSIMYLIQELLSEARFIHIIRDGRDVALSIKDLWWGPNTVEETAKWWASGIEDARNQIPDLQWYLEIRYEDLVLDTELTLRKVCDFIALPWSASMLDYDKRAEERLIELTSVLAPEVSRVISAEDRQKIHSLVSRPPETSRVGRWKIEMANSDQECFNRTAGEMLRELGYDTS